MISACRALFMARVRSSIELPGVLRGVPHRRHPGAVLEAADSSRARYSSVSTYTGSSRSRICSGSGSKMKSPRAASSSRSASSVSRRSSDSGRSCWTVTLWTSADSKRVVDDDDPVDLLVRVELGDPVRDRLRVRVTGLVGEAGELPESSKRLKRREPTPRRPTPTQRTCLPSLAKLALERESPPQDLGVERPGEAAVARQRARWQPPARSRFCRSGSPRTDELARAVPAISSSIRSAYGRMSSMRACARFSFAAATSSSARVILRRVPNRSDAPLDVLDSGQLRRASRSPRRGRTAGRS